MQIALVVPLIFLTFAASAVSAQNPAIDNAVALGYFHEAEAASKLDNGKLWGKPLYGPMLFIDPATRIVVANQASPEGVLVREGDVYIGKLPPTVSIANYSATWAGVHWTMLIWGMVPDNKYERLNLMMHELFHRIQDDLGFPAIDPPNDQLDTLEGRVWLQLEWRALHAALNSKDKERHKAIVAALTFRAYRRSLFPGSAQSERKLEMNEGLAEYTGAMLASQGESREVLIRHVSEHLEQGPRRPTFVRSFAYYTGPEYGVLLNESYPAWRHDLKVQDDLAVLLQKSLKIAVAKNLRIEAEKLAKGFDSDSLRTAELERDGARKKTIAGYKARLVDGPTLTIPLTDKKRYSFNPSTLIPMDSTATIYPTEQVIDDWGVLDVTNGALMVGKNGMLTSVVVALPTGFDAKKMDGDGWKLKLERGWAIEPAQKPECYELKRRVD